VDRATLSVLTRSCGLDGRLAYSAEAEVKASDGEVRTFSAGSVLLFEDTSGKGHDTNIGRKEDFETAIVQLE
jgi:hypothetical protein